VPNLSGIIAINVNRTKWCHRILVIMELILILHKSKNTKIMW
jgi:hypothetical protein